MAQPAPSPLPAHEPAAHTRPSTTLARQRRWVAVCLLLLIVAATITAYLLRARSSPAGAALEGESCPAPGETTAASCLLPENASATREPFPAEAEAQVDWVLRYHQPAMVLFYSRLCKPCMMMEALVQVVRHDYEPTVTFIEVLSDHPGNAALVQRMGVGSIPASVFITASGDSKRIVGLMKQQDLRAELATLAAAGQPLLPTPTVTLSP